MSGEAWRLFTTFGFFIILLFTCGLYCIIVTRNLIRAIIGMELLIKSATLLFIVVGSVTGREAITQSLVITIIVIEVIVAVIAGGISLRIYRHTNSLDARGLKKLKG
jgi:NADH-quinone oxidoreductase subunit K